jgi:hypothetical protein
MKSIESLDFGTVIAYLLPGFLAFYGLRYISPVVDQLVALTYTKDGRVTIGIVILLFSLSAGVVVSAVRANVLDLIQERTGVEKPPFDFSKLKSDDKVLKAYEAAISNTYRFAQSYGNTFVALLFVAVAKTWAAGGPLAGGPVMIVIGISLIVLFIVHRQQLRDSYATIGGILS